MRIKLGKTPKHVAGLYTPDNDKIRVSVNEDANPALTFIHELLHKLLHDAGITFRTEEAEERWVRRFEKLMWDSFGVNKKKQVLKHLVSLNGRKK